MSWQSLTSRHQPNPRNVSGLKTTLYSVQALCMLYELKGIMVKKFVIIMTCENGEVEVYQEYDKRKYINLLSEYIREFVESKLKSLKEDQNIKLKSKFYC